MTSQQALSLQPGDRIITTDLMQNQVMSYVEYEDQNGNFPIGTIFEVVNTCTSSAIFCKIVIDNELKPTASGSYIIHSYYFPCLQLLTASTIVACDLIVY